MSDSSFKKLSEDFLSEDPAAFIKHMSYIIRYYGLSNLARNAGFNRISIWRWMNGKQDIKLSSFIKILRVLGFSVSFRPNASAARAMRFFLRWQEHQHILELIKREKEMADEVEKQQ